MFFPPLNKAPSPGLCLAGLLPYHSVGSTSLKLSPDLISLLLPKPFPECLILAPRQTVHPAERSEPPTPLSQAHILIVFVIHLANAAHMVGASLLTVAMSWAPADLCSSGHLILFRLSPCHVLSEGT